MNTTTNTLVVGGRYNWRNQPERLVFIGRNWSGNGYWNQFEKVGEPGKVWCEVLDSDLHMIEKTTDALAAPEPAAQGEDGTQPSRPKPRMPISPLGIEDFCYCDNTVSLQAVSGGGAPEGYLGKVQLKVNGEFVSYVREGTAQKQGRGEAICNPTATECPRCKNDHGRAFADTQCKMAQASAPPAQPAERVPEGLQSALREAAEVLQMVADSGANLPPNWRWPLLDELSGYAHMLLAATPAAPAEEGDGEGVNDTLARELYIASQCDVHNLHTLAWSELTEATRDEWRKKATGAAR